MKQADQNQMKKKMNRWNNFLKNKQKMKRKYKRRMKRIQQKQKRKFNKCLQRHLAYEYIRIILQIRLSETKTQELRIEEESIHQNKHT
jgi:hypothetical protein